MGNRGKERFAKKAFALKNDSVFQETLLFKDTTSVINIGGNLFLMNVDPIPARNKAALLLFLPALLRCLSFLVLPFGPQGPRMLSFSSF